MSFSEPKLVALAVLPKISGGLSVIFSGCIVFTVLRDQSRRKVLYHRLLLGISCCDISASFWLAMSTWPIPSESGVKWAIGNDRTCQVQGFFTQLGIWSSFYNASLSIYYTLVIRYNWKERELRKLEWFMHGVPALWSICSAVSGLILDVFGNATLWCWVVEPEFDHFRWVAFYGPLWCMIGIVTLNCGLILEYVQRVERSAQAHRFQDAVDTSNRLSWRNAQSIRGNQPSGVNAAAPSRPQSSSNLRSSSRRTREVANQSFLYAGAFYINWAALTVTRLLQTTNGNVYYPLLLIAAITVPMQGLPNFCIFLLPRYICLRKERPQGNLWIWFKESMSRTPPLRSGGSGGGDADAIEEDPSNSLQVTVGGTNSTGLELAKNETSDQNSES